eukprot:7785677-Alexandrium_andersonii.AAC.1
MQSAMTHRFNQLHIQTTHWLKSRRGPHSTWMRLRSQEAPEGSTSFSRACYRQKNGVPKVSALRAGGAALRAAPAAHRAATEG